MKIEKAVITAAGRNQRTLPLQTLIDRDGMEKSMLGILVEEVLSAGVEEIAIIVVPGDEVAYAEVVGDHLGRLHFIPQEKPLGYGHAVYCARDFVGDAPFLHLVGDHLYVSNDAPDSDSGPGSNSGPGSDSGRSCAQQLVEVARAEACAVSAVQATRENLLPYYGTIGGRRAPGRKDLYIVETVVEKPTPTEAELTLMVPGLRAGHYLCFFGMHVLTPTVMDILGKQVEEMESANSAEILHAVRNDKRGGITLSGALNVLAMREKYLALEENALRYDVGVKYGLLIAQLALALSGKDREEVLTRLLELLTQRALTIQQ